MKIDIVIYIKYINLYIIIKNKFYLFIYLKYKNKFVKI